MGIKEWFAKKKEKNRLEKEYMEQIEKEVEEELKGEIKDDIKKATKERIKKKYLDKSKPIDEKIKDFGNKLGGAIGSSSSFDDKMKRILGSDDRGGTPSKNTNTFDNALNKMIDNKDDNTEKKLRRIL